MEAEGQVLHIPEQLLRYFVALETVLLHDLQQEPLQGVYVVEASLHLPRLSPRAWTWLLDVLIARHYTYRLSKKFYKGQEEDPTTPLVSRGARRLRDFDNEELAALLAFADFYDVACARQWLAIELAEKFLDKHMDARKETSSSSGFVAQSAVERVLMPLVAQRQRDIEWLRRTLGSLDLVAAVTQCWPQLGPLVACGNSHTLFVARDGLWGTGSSRSWQMGFDGRAEPGGVWTQPRALYKRSDDDFGVMAFVVSVACGDDFSMALLANGELWSCGTNEDGALGRGVFPDDQDTLTGGWAIARNDVVAVACGARHTLIVVQDGSLWACGDNSDGQLGLNDRETRANFASLADALGPLYPTGRVLQISCGARHSAILTTTGLWMCGANQSSQLGTGDSLGNDRPTLLDVPNVARVQCGTMHTLIETREGLWGFGSSQNGELGLKTKLEVSRPTLLDSGKLGYDVLNFAGGLDHSAALTETGLWATGEIGGTVRYAFAPLVLPEGAGDALFVICSRRGQGTTFVGATHGLYACGDNHKGQLGTDKWYKRVNLLTLVPITLGFEEHEKREATEPLPEEDERETQRRRLGGLLCTRCDRLAVAVDTLSHRLRFCSRECCHAHYTRVSVCIASIDAVVVNKRI